MKKKTILKVFFSVMTVFLALTCTLASIKTKKIKADTLSDLTNTTWVINNNANWFSNTTYYINFLCNGNNYTGIKSVIDHGNFIYYLPNQSSTIWDAFNGWTSDVYKTIEITGGSDVTNSNLISWLQNNATQQLGPQPTQITHKYWSPYGVIIMQDNDRIGDDEIQYTVLYNQFTDNFDEETLTGLYFLGVQVDDPNVQWSYIYSIHDPGIDILYHGTTNNIDNTMWLEFTYGDYMSSELYDFMELWGYWFDDEEAYIVGMNQGYVEGTDHGRLLGQADGLEYTNLITNIFNGIGGLLNIQIFPNITIGLILGLPLLLGVFVIIIKILRG